MSAAQTAPPAPDPFEVSLTTATNRLEALKRVKLAQEHLRDTRARAHKNIEAAEIAVVDAMKAADRMGAYELIPVDARPMLPAVAP